MSKFVQGLDQVCLGHRCIQAGKRHRFLYSFSCSAGLKDGVLTASMSLCCPALARQAFSYLVPCPSASARNNFAHGFFSKADSLFYYASILVGVTLLSLPHTMAAVSRAPEPTILCELGLPCTLPSPKEPFLFVASES